MISLSTFLTNYIISQNDNLLSFGILNEQIKKGVYFYIKYLQTDNPKTIEWANIEKQLIIALEHMEAPDEIKLQSGKFISIGDVTKLNLLRDGDNANTK